MKLFLLLAAVFCLSSSLPIVPYNYHMVCQQLTQACQIVDQCGNSQIQVNDILSTAGLSLMDFINFNPALGQIVPSGYLPPKQLVCVAAFWQGH